MLKNSRIAGVGHYVPENVVTNDDLVKMMETSDEWIQERTGIKERRWFTYGKDTVASMGTNAALGALKMANVHKEDVDFIIVATLSPDYFFPGPGVGVQKLLEIDNIGALDIRNQCSGFIYALSVADQFIKTGMYKNILVIGSEIQSHRLDKTSRGRSVSVIFGDGAGAVLLQPSDAKSKGILSTHLHSQGEHALELCTIGPGNTVPTNEDGQRPEYIYPQMNGSAVFKHAVGRFQEVINEGLKANDLSIEDLDLLIPHQANLRISQFIQKKLSLEDHQVFSNIQKYGNTTAASIPIALSEAYQEGRIKENDLICMAAFGSGFTWASAMVRW